MFLTKVLEHDQFCLYITVFLYIINAYKCNNKQAKCLQIYKYILEVKNILGAYSSPQSGRQEMWSVFLSLRETRQFDLRMEGEIIFR